MKAKLAASAFEALCCIVAAYSERISAVGRPYSNCAAVEDFRERVCKVSLGVGQQRSCFRCSRKADRKRA